MRTRPRPPTTHPRRARQRQWGGQGSATLVDCGLSQAQLDHFKEQGREAFGGAISDEQYAKFAAVLWGPQGGVGASKSNKDRSAPY